MKAARHPRRRRSFDAARRDGSRYYARITMPCVIVSEDSRRGKQRLWEAGVSGERGRRSCRARRSDERLPGQRAEAARAAIGSIASPAGSCLRLSSAGSVR